MAYCQRCASRTIASVPPGDGREREVCPSCGFIRYDNPKLVVGVVLADERQVILCRRNIEPRRGFWTIPAGFLELGEPAAFGAQREAFEETGLVISIERPLVHFDIPEIGQIYMMFRAPPPSFDGEPPFDPTETLEVKTFQWHDLPWSELAFDAVRFALELYRNDLDRNIAALHYGTIRRDPAASTHWGTQRLMDYWSIPLGARLYTEPKPD